MPANPYPSIFPPPIIPLAVSSKKRKDNFPYLRLDDLNVTPTYDIYPKCMVPYPTATIRRTDPTNSYKWCQDDLIKYPSQAQVW